MTDHLKPHTLDTLPTGVQDCLQPQTIDALLTRFALYFAAPGIIKRSYIYHYSLIPLFIKPYPCCQLSLRGSNRQLFIEKLFMETAADGLARPKSVFQACLLIPRCFLLLIIRVSFVWSPIYLILRETGRIITFRFASSLTFFLSDWTNYN